MNQEHKEPKPSEAAIEETIRKLREVLESGTSLSEALITTIDAYWRFVHRNPEIGYMSRIGRKGGKVGGAARMAGMTKKQRQTLARKAARARWGRRGR